MALIRYIRKEDSRPTRKQLQNLCKRIRTEKRLKKPTCKLSNDNP